MLLIHVSNFMVILNGIPKEKKKKSQLTFFTINTNAICYKVAQAGMTSIALSSPSCSKISE